MPLLAAAAVGAMSGALIGGGLDLLMQLNEKGWNADCLDQQRLGAAMLQGFVLGAISGGVGGISAKLGMSAVSAGVLGAIADFAGGVVYDGLVNHKSLEQAAVDNLLGAGIGFGIGMVGHGVAKWFGRNANEMVERAARNISETIPQRRWHTQSATDGQLANALSIRKIVSLDGTERRNIGFMNFDIDGITGHKFSVSGDFDNDSMYIKMLNRSKKKSQNLQDFVTLLPEEDRQFVTFTYNGIARHVDTEAKLLEWLVSPSGLNISPQSSGTISLFTERIPCPSCSGVLDQFNSRYPYIDISVASKHSE